MRRVIHSHQLISKHGADLDYGLSIVVPDPEAVLISDIRMGRNAHDFPMDHVCRTGAATTFEVQHFAPDENCCRSRQPILCFRVRYGGCRGPNWHDVISLESLPHVVDLGPVWGIQCLHRELALVDLHSVVVHIERFD